MRWKIAARTAFRRRAIVGGRALEADGRPFVDAASLSLCAADAPAGDADAASVSTSRAAPWTRCYPCHLRPDGSFFFLDVPPGRYALRRIGPDGLVVQQSEDISVPAPGPDAGLPLAHIEFGIVRPALRPRKP